MTINGEKLTRIKDHKKWLEDEPDSIKIHVASIGYFSTWDEASKKQSYAPPEKETIEKIESLLIYAHQPIYNKRSVKSSLNSDNIRIFNTGKFGKLLPEVSGRYYIGEKNFSIGDHQD